MKFFKMHGSGNDFVLFITSDKEQSLFTRPLIRKICRRHYGIGADGLILVLPARSKGADLQMRIFNADGSEAEMCGNGIRCLGKLAYEERLTNKKNLIIETISGKIAIKLIAKNNKVSRVSVTIAAPSTVRKISESKFKVIMGNPHCVLFIKEDIKTFPVSKYGPLLEKHRLFPQGANVEFVRVKHRGAIDLRVWERGVGETLACGTGACAAFIAGLSAHKLQANGVKVKLPGGLLNVFKLKNGKIMLSGPAEMVCAGDINHA
jgi:diaminopimelate epimerase